jgi:chemotaxis-related protein WspB
MVALIFEVDGQRYGLDVTQILEVLPAVPLRRLPRVPEYVAGVFRHRGVMVPVIDLCRLIGTRPAEALLSTRIILVRHPGPSGAGRALGLLAERATSLDETSSEPRPSGFAAPEAPFLGDLSATGTMIQYVNVEHLLPSELRERLFVKE